MKPSYKSCDQKQLEKVCQEIQGYRTKKEDAEKRKIKAIREGTEYQKQQEEKMRLLVSDLAKLGIEADFYVNIVEYGHDCQSKYKESSNVLSGVCISGNFAILKTPKWIVKSSHGGASPIVISYRNPDSLPLHEDDIKTIKEMLSNSYIGVHCQKEQNPNIGLLIQFIENSHYNHKSYRVSGTLSEMCKTEIKRLMNIEI